MPKNGTYWQWFLRRRGGLFAVLIVFAVVTVAAALPDRLRIAKMGGDVDVADVPDGGSIKTMGGNVHVGKVLNEHQHQHHGRQYRGKTGFLGVTRFGNSMQRTGDGTAYAGLGGGC